MPEQKFHEFLYRVENILDEFLIGVLSFGAIFVTLNAFLTSSGLSWTSWGKLIFEWIVMLGLMIIGRELWLLNRNLRQYMAQDSVPDEHEHEEGE
ncbi:MAG: hypothetical protein ABEJ75_04270 [Candidatus Nanohaloarchaea archaeon]